jgi:hypothetical protein
MYSVNNECHIQIDCFILVSIWFRVYIFEIVRRNKWCYFTT